MKPTRFSPMATVILTVLAAFPIARACGQIANAAPQADTVQVANAQHPALPRPAHVVIVIEENRGYEHILHSDDASYINHLAQIGASFTNAHAIRHPSQPNYIALFCGSIHGVINDGRPKDLPWTTPNLGAALRAAGFSFVGYSEALPKAGFDGNNDGHPHGYRRKHNPWVNWQADDKPLPANALSASVNQPFSSFPSDYSKLPTVSFVIPTLANDMHDGSIATADAWLKKNLDGYIQWARTHDSLFILTFDEDHGQEHNRIPLIFVGQMVKPGRYDRKLDHYDVLRTLEDMYGLPYAGHSKEAKPITSAWIASHVRG